MGLDRASTWEAPDHAGRDRRVRRLVDQNEAAERTIVGIRCRRDPPVQRDPHCADIVERQLGPLPDVAVHGDDLFDRHRG